MTPDNPITHVSDTAKWVAMYRALESERPDPLFRDPYARRLAGPEGAAIVEAMPKGRAMAWPMIVRTAVLDELILRAVRRDGVDTVLNLAAGLDTRPYRLDLPADLRWWEADLPDMIGYKEAALEGEPPRCRLERARVDLADPAAREEFLDRATREARRALVITEGLLIYLDADAVGGLARALHARPALQWWLTDLGGPRLLKLLAKTWGPLVAAGGAPFRFAPAEGTAFFARFGWREVEFRPMMDESLRLGRTMRFGRFWGWLGRFYPRRLQEEMRRMSGMVLLGRTAPPGAP
jgi:methyltransferase (TIGR00027 family)